jgi:hypothetical protein
MPGDSLKFPEYNRSETHGYHGTSARIAREIKANGFKTYGDIFFALFDNLSFAERHGHRRAEEEGDEHYAVIHARFPSSPVKFGLGGGDQVQVSPEQSHLIQVIDILFFDTKTGRRILDNTKK